MQLRELCKNTVPVSMLLLTPVKNGRAAMYACNLSEWEGKAAALLRFAA